MLKSPRIAVLAASALLAVAVLVSGFALGSVPDADGSIHGCYRTNSGRLRVIDSDEGQRCRTHETALEWNQDGPTGPPGPPGPPGSGGGAAAHFIDLQLFGARIFGGANFTTGFGPHGGLRLPSTSAVPSFDYQFTIPPDYTTGGTLTVRIIWHTSSTDCQMFLRPNSISVARPGRAHIIGPFASTGLDGVGGDLLQAPSTSNVTQQKTYTINSPVPATALQPGDNVIFGLFRDLREGHEDTCTADLTIQGVSIVY